MHVNNGLDFHEKHQHRSEDEPLLVNRQQAARLLGLHPNSIDKLRLQGDLPMVNLLPGKALFAVADVFDLIERHRAAMGDDKPARGEDTAR